MDQDTLTNHISKLGIKKFNEACILVLRNIFHYKPISVDGKYDGGTDLALIDNEGKRTSVAYQLTTQKTDIKNKGFKDAKKAIEKLNVSSFFYFPTYNISEIDSRKLETRITDELGISARVFGPNILAGLILEEKLLNRFLDELDYPMPRDYLPQGPGYRERALHSYTLMSREAKNLKEGIYDDTILFILSGEGGMQEGELILKVVDFLGLDFDSKQDLLKNRIGALFGTEQIIRLESGEIALSQEAHFDINARKRIYDEELKSFSAAQTDLLRDEYQSDWTVEDSRQVSVWIADAFINDRMTNLKEIKVSIVSNPLINVENDSISKIKEYLKKKKKIAEHLLDKLILDLLEIASGHPLIIKITRASMYLALEGGNPISKAKALGANRWSDFKVMVEPSVAIPFLCSQLYSGYVNRFFQLSVDSIKRIQQLGARAWIPTFYINECAGHLLRARKYINLQLNEDELQYSSNAFVANYYALKKQGVNLPPNFLEYLSTFSSAIKVERTNTKQWVRSLMTDVQSHLGRAGVEFIYIPKFTEGDCIDFEKEYTFLLDKGEIEKPKHLVQHDIWALQFTNDEIMKRNHHWIILTYDKSLISFSKAELYNGLATTPGKLIDITESTKPLSETHFVSLLHSVATYSEKTLSAGARIMDRVIKYASEEIQDWEFQKEIEEFKNSLIESIDMESIESFSEIDRRTDEFLKKRGITMDISDNEEVDD